MADKYILRITAGGDYDEANHVQVPVNQPETVRITTAHADIELNVRIQGYNGLPLGSPSTSAYFDAEPHAYNQDQYSISFRFTPKRSAATSSSSSSSSGVAVNGNDKEEYEIPNGISGSDLQFGNDFDRPIRDKLPPGFGTALRIVQWWIDPGLQGDAYANRPYLYGPALSSFNVLHLGAGEHEAGKGGLWFEEGGDATQGGLQTREALGLPDTGKARMKWALADANKDRFVFEYGKTYGLDFFNPYLDFANLALKLPGFQLSIANYWDGQALRTSDRRSHQLRYVLRNKTTEQVYLVVVFSLFLREDIDEHGNLKEGAEQHIAGGDKPTTTVAAAADNEHTHDETEALKQARDEFGTPHNETNETNEDDVD